MKEKYIYCTKYQEWYSSLDKVKKEKDFKFECDRECLSCEYHKEMWVEED